MAHTNRKQVYNRYRKEAKPARKETARELRRKNHAACHEALSYRGEVEVSFPKYQRTSGWLTW